MSGPGSGVVAALAKVACRAEEHPEIVPRFAGSHRVTWEDDHRHRGVTQRGYFYWNGDGLCPEVHARPTFGRAPHLLVVAAQVTLDLAATSVGFGAAPR